MIVGPQEVCMSVPHLALYLFGRREAFTDLTRVGLGRHPWSSMTSDSGWSGVGWNIEDDELDSWNGGSNIHSNGMCMKDGH